MLLNRLPSFLLSWPRVFKQVLALAVDASLCLLSLHLAASVRFEAWVPLSGPLLWAGAGAVALALPLFVQAGFYRAIFRYSGLNALMAVVRAMSVYGLVFMTVVTVVGVPGIPRSVGVTQPLLLLVFVGLSRALVRYWLGGLYRDMLDKQGPQPVLIYGAGSAGRQLVAALSNSNEMRVAGFLDDDAELHDRVINGVRVYGVDDLPDVIERHHVSLVLMAIPSASRAQRNEILNVLRQHKLKVRTLPGLMDMAHGRVNVSDLRELDIEDLLGRDPVKPDAQLLDKNIRGKVVMVTGAGGSIGSELCRQIVLLRPTVLLLVELTEFALYAIAHELEHSSETDTDADSEVILVPLLASVRDGVRMGEILATWKPDTVYHAAAYKHVPLVEHNPAEGVKNNVQGTLITALQCALHGVSDFVLISTDKAVRPTNVMGTSKRLAEMVLQSHAAVMAARNGKTRFSMVRFGNVLGSSGSVVPLFRKQIERGGPITLTDARITRYFMTIPEAAQLVIQAGAMASGGDVFVLDMGEPVKVLDLAKRMVELSGLAVKDEANPNGDIEIKVTGLRPGEKLYEELLIGDNPLPTVHRRIMKAHEDFLPWDVLQDKLTALNSALDVNDVRLIRRLLKDLVPGYQPDGSWVDWVWMESEKVA
ncbi:polysaccharide biosynthesis protein [Limnohabitans sp. T6-5]|uniref:polysaccharide biosynthesis protein n=1 Tax=Limnohabitans sp. T6-5 TaxID=1100724 RepID=UPI000D3C4C27|nr:nucleoside-diphosphate sugar epimerase/dehydratase [Limnohabitans sp. T6-5]PUE08616.1 polysaccharide biosynthesis protein [Limnohabitans sp. T6-5]